MINPTIPQNESARIDALLSLDILDTIEEEAFDQITLLASQICNVPIALVSLIDKNRQWFKSHHGLDVSETPRYVSFCAHAINSPDEIFVVEDASKDERFHDNPLSTDAPNVIFYAGAPLNTADGYCLGTLCVIGNEPHTLNPGQLSALKTLANQVIAQLELRKSNQVLKEKLDLIQQLNFDLDAFSYRLSHDIQTPVRGIMSIVHFLKEDNADEISDVLLEKIEQIERRARYGLSLVNSALDYTRISRADFKYSLFKLEDVANYVFSHLVSREKAELKLIDCDHVICSSEYAIQLIFQNLITNSLKFNDKPTCHISISAKLIREQITIDYKDNGPGIDSQFRKKIFEIFETLQPKSVESIGIGLSIVKTVLNHLSGEIELISEKNSTGVHFKITLPNKTGNTLTSQK